MQSIVLFYPNILIKIDWIEHLNCNSIFFKRGSNITWRDVNFFQKIERKEKLTTVEQMKLHNFDFQWFLPFSQFQIIWPCH